MDSWQVSWVQSCDDFTAMPFHMQELSQVVKLTSCLSGTKLSFILSNLYGKTDLLFDEIWISRSPSFHVKHRVTYFGKSAITVGKGSKIQVDAIEMPIKCKETIYVYLRVKTAQVYADFCCTYATKLVNASISRKAEYIPRLTENNEHRKGWFCLEQLLVWSQAQPLKVQIGGDSLAEMGLITQHISQWLLNNYPEKVTCANTGVSGSRLLHDAPDDKPILQTYGKSLVKRMQETQYQADISIIFCGGNDLILPFYSTAAAKQVVTVAQLIAGFKKIQQQCSGHLLLGTILPTSKIDQKTEEIRLQVNNELLGWPNVFDAAGVVQGAKSEIAAEFDFGDQLHVNAAGAKKIVQRIIPLLQQYLIK